MQARSGPSGPYQLTAAEIAAATGGRYIFGFTASGISIDTRSLQPGDLFVALTASRDGHDYVAEAFAKGAVGALVSRAPAGAAGPMVFVPDTQAALEDIARYARGRSHAQVIAVTGSVGKTSTKEMLRCALQGQARVHAAVESHNNHIGVPLTLARLPEHADVAIIEIGMNHPGEIRPLSRLTEPDVAIVTAVAPAHLAAFRNLDSITLEKAQVFAGLRPDGVAIYNADAPRADILARAAAESSARAVPFGTDAPATARILLLEPTDRGNVAFILISGQVRSCTLNSPGTHIASNAMAALAAVEALGYNMTLSTEALSSWAPPAGRGTREQVAIAPGIEIELIDDAFNSNPASITAGLETLAASSPRPGGRRIAILGDMLELGNHEYRLHAEIALLPSIQSIDRIDCIGPRMAALWEALPECKRGLCLPGPNSFPTAGRYLDGDVVLVKGSKGSRASQVAESLRQAAIGKVA